MLFRKLLVSLLPAAATLPTALALPNIWSSDWRDGHAWDRNTGDVVRPKIMIISMFSYEADAWHGIPEFNLLEKNVTVIGFSPQYPEAHCTSNGEICQVVTAMGGTYSLTLCFLSASHCSGSLLQSTESVCNIHRPPWR